MTAITAHAEQAIKHAWDTYKKVEKHGLNFGKVCYTWREKFKAQGSRTGDGLRPILDKVRIPRSTAYFWINRYMQSIGIKPVQLHDKQGPVVLTPGQGKRLVQVACAANDLAEALKYGGDYSELLGEYERCAFDKQTLAAFAATATEDSINVIADQFRRLCKRDLDRLNPMIRADLVRILGAPQQNEDEKLTGIEMGAVQ